MNRLPYIVKGFKTGKGSIKQGMKLYDHFGSKTQIELDAITKDSIFQNEIIFYDEKFIFNAIPPGWGGWSDTRKKPIINIHRKSIPISRKDSARTAKENNIMIEKAIDSILKKYQ